MQESALAKVAVLIASEDPYGAWHMEAIRKIGLLCDVVKPQDLTQIARYSTLILLGEDALGSDHVRLITDWSKNRGSIVAVAGTWGLDELLGVTPIDEPLNDDRVIAAEEPLIWPKGALNARFFGGRVVKPSGAEVLLHTESGQAAATRKDRAFFFAPHLGQTAALMAMGSAVESDGVGPPDTSAFLADGVPRAEDGSRLSFLLDRRAGQTDGAPAFLDPYLDTLRGVLARLVFSATESTGRSAVTFWPWPDNSPAAAACTVECSALSADGISHSYGALAQTGMPATWLIPTPGMAAEVYRSILRWDHSVGLLARHEQDSTTEKLRVQYLTISRASGSKQMVAHRSADGRWKGRSQAYRASEEVGNLLSLNKGGRQPGTSGFLFGTSHPFSPLPDSTGKSEVLELPYAIFQPGQQCPVHNFPALIHQASAAGGCLHFSFDTTLLQDTAATQNLMALLTLIRKAGMRQMTPDAVYHFEIGRRKLRSSWHGAVLGLIAERPLEGFTVLVQGAQHQADIAGRRRAPEPTTRFGHTFTPFVLDLEQKSQAQLKFRLERNQAA
jgi:hypothetical protein